MKINITQTIVAIFVLPTFFLIPNYVKADRTFTFKMISIYPQDGSSGIPQNLQGGTTGSVCYGGNNSSTVCSLMIGLANTSDSPSGDGCPVIDTSSINSNTATVSSPNDSNISIKYIGAQSGCTVSQAGVYYSTIELIIYNTDFSNGIILMPNSTYTINFKGGTDGIKATYSGNSNYPPTLVAYPDQDYSFTFTTASGLTPVRQLTPTPTPSPTNTPNISANTNNNNLSQPTNVQTVNPSSSQTQITVPTLSPTPTLKATSQKTTKLSAKILGVQSNPSSSPSAKPTNNGQPAQSPAQKNPARVFEMIVNFLSGILSGLFHR